MANLEITLKRGLAGKRKDQKEVAASLGLRKTGTKRIHPDNPQTQGKVKKIEHLVSVREI